ncbi:MAG: ParB/RepB/Spo0J family partition protein [Bacteroidales bacterium]|nr:ParB/RepB/Spo0J family partition protein [Bacteroidales bacterium]
MAKQKQGGLGRGLGSILPDADDLLGTSTNVTTAVDTIPLDKIETNPNQPRKEFDEEALNQLAESIKHQGVITPITVRKMPSNTYQIIAGERRYRASKMAGLTEIPAYIRVATDSQMMEMALVENIQRENLNAMEVAFSYKALLEECQLTQEDLGQRVGKDRSTISNYLRLLNLPSETQIALQQEKLSMGHARCLAGVEDVDKHLELLHAVIDRGLSVHQLEVLAKSANETPKKPAVKKSDLPARHATCQSNLRQHLQSEVEIKRSRRGKGTVTIHFNSDSDFERLMNLINK